MEEDIVTPILEKNRIVVAVVAQLILEHFQQLVRIFGMKITL